MNERRVLMRHFSYSLSFLAGGLCLILLAVPSFGSDRFIQEEAQEKSVAPATAPQIAVPFSPDSALHHDVRVHILSFLPEQKDLLRIGVASKSWRKAAAKLWDNRTLDLSNKPLTEADYQALAKGIFPRLRLNKVKLDEEGMKILATCSHLQALELRGNHLRATESLIKLLSLARLSHIDLYNNMIDIEGAKAIAEAVRVNKTLTTVDLGYNSIGPEGVKAMADALKQNKTLTTVDLGYNDIGDEGAKAIARALLKNRMLTTVDLRHNTIGDEGAKAMAEAMKQNTTLITVDLRKNWIGDEGAKAIAAALSQNKTLTAVYLNGSMIGAEGTKALACIKHSRPSLKLEY